MTDELWGVIEPLLPPEPEKRKGGRPRIPDRDVLRGILFVLSTGAAVGAPAARDGPWLGDDLLAAAQGVARGRGPAPTPPSLARPPGRGRQNRLVTRFAGLLGGARGKGGGEAGASPTERGRSGTKRHVVADRQGIPLAVRLSAANVHDSRMMLDAVDATEPLKRPAGRPRKRPAKLHADEAYDSEALREESRRRSITPRIARKGVESSGRLGRHRRVVERALSWLNRYRRLRVRCERRAGMHLAFLHIGCALICWNFINH